MNIELTREYFSPFRDPATALKISEDQVNIYFEISRNAVLCKYRINKETRSVLDRNANKQFPSVESLISSDQFANIRGFADTQIRVAGDRESGLYINPNVSFGDGERVDGLEELNAIVSIRSNQKTRTILIDGPAGVGKTRLLERLEWMRASAHLDGEDIAPLLYVSSRGQRLSNLRSELAASTQRLMASFTFEQVPVLMRLGLICLAIDGFDELVDSDGYQDAWFALRGFFDSLKGSGTCLLAGRDTFFDTEGFTRRLERYASQIDLVQVHVAPLTSSDAINWLEQEGWSDSEIARPETKEIFREGSYALRPFFLSELAKAKGWDVINESYSTRQFLISRFIKREAALIKRVVSLDEAKAEAALNVMFREIAKDMIERESNEVDVDFISFLCDFSFGEHLPAIDVNKIAHRAGSIGLLEKANADNLRKFPHSEILYHFYSLSLIEDLLNKEIPISLRRAVLGSDFIEVFQDAVESFSIEAFCGAMDFLSESLESTFSSDRFPQNGGAILLGSLTRNVEEMTRSLCGLQVAECRLDGPISPARISATEIYRLNAVGADFSRVEFDSVHISMLVADELVVFGESAPVVDAIHLMAPGGVVHLRDKGSISGWFAERKRSASEKTDKNPLLEYFERLCKKALKQFYFSLSGDDFGSDLLNSEYWEPVSEILERYGRLDYRVIPASGRNATMAHLKRPGSLLHPDPADLDSLAILSEIKEASKSFE